MNHSIFAAAGFLGIFLVGCAGHIETESTGQAVSASSGCELVEGVFTASPPEMVVDIANNDTWSYLDAGSSCPTGAACFVWAQVGGSTQDGGAAYSLVGQGKCR